jgi:hypothetical protein
MSPSTLTPLKRYLGSSDNQRKALRTTRVPFNFFVIMMLCENLRLKFVTELELEGGHGARQMRVPGRAAGGQGK